MKLSELIRDAQAIINDHGDLEIAKPTHGAATYYKPILISLGILFGEIKRKTIHENGTEHTVKQKETICKLSTSIEVKSFL